MTEKPKHPAAGDTPAPADEATLKALARFGEAQCPIEEVAPALGLTLAKLKRLLKKDAAARQAYEKARALGLVALREAQLKLAGTSAPMAMMLAKVYLGHEERRESDEGDPIDYIGAAERVRAKIAAIAAEELASRSQTQTGEAG